MDKPSISVPIDILRSMFDAMEIDDTLSWCETCGAWIDEGDDALASTDGFVGCWKAATVGDPRWDHLCRSERGTLIDELRMLEKEAGVVVPPGSVGA